MDKIARIRQEIERLKKENDNIKCNSNEAYCRGYGDAFVDLLAVLDTLSEEPDKSLEEAAEEYLQQVKARFLRTLEHPTAKDAFIAGAEWQASQMPMPEDTVLFNKGVEEGRRLEREDMLKDAYVESQIVEDGRIELGGNPLPCLNPIILLPYPQFKLYDKVRIIIVKEDSHE